MVQLNLLLMQFQHYFYICIHKCNNFVFFLQKNRQTSTTHTHTRKRFVSNWTLSWIYNKILYFSVWHCDMKKIVKIFHYYVLSFTFVVLFKKWQTKIFVSIWTHCNKRPIERTKQPNQFPYELIWNHNGRELRRRINNRSHKKRNLVELNRRTKNMIR